MFFTQGQHAHASVAHGTRPKLASLIAVVFLLMPGVTQTPAAEKPNIILFVADDHGYHDSGVYGDSVVRTPNIDRLARESMRMTHAFAASPLCVPSRCVIQTGLMPARNGGHAFGTGIKEHVKTLPEYFDDLGYRTVHVGKWHHGNGRQPKYDVQQRNIAAAVEILAEHDRSEPLLLVVCTNPPHLPWSKNVDYDLDEIQLPPNFVDTPETRQCRAEYYTDVTLMDGILGGVLDAVEEHGYAENTLLIYTSDQGANWPFAKWCVYDGGLRVPMLVRWPGHIRPGTTTDAMISFADLLPTFVEAAGGKAPNDIDGRSFLGVVTGKKDQHREVVFGTHTGYMSVTPGITNHSPMRTVRTRTHRYILNLDAGRTFTTHITGCGPKSRWYVAFWDSWVERAETDAKARELVDAYQHRPVEELYDVIKDPYERNNLAGDPQYAELMESMRSRLSDWREQQGDTTPLVLPEQTPAPLPEDLR